MHLKPESISPDHYEDFKNLVHRAITDITAEIKNPDHPRQEKFAGDGTPFVPSTASQNPAVAALQDQVAELSKQLEARQAQIAQDNADRATLTAQVADLAKKLETLTPKA